MVTGQMLAPSNGSVFGRLALGAYAFMSQLMTSRARRRAFAGILTTFVTNWRAYLFSSFAPAMTRPGGEASGQSPDRAHDLLRHPMCHPMRQRAGLAANMASATLQAIKNCYIGDH